MIFYIVNRYLYLNQNATDIYTNVINKQKMSEFTQHYKNLSNYELIKILSESDKYNPEAIETANLELNSRNLNPEEISDYQELISSKQWENSKLNKQKKQIEKAVFKAGDSFVKNLDPIQKGPVTIERYIYSILIIFAGLSIYTIYKEYDFLQFLIFSGDMGWDLSMLDYFMPILLLPIATIAFFMRKKIGWILLVMFSTYTIVSVMVILIFELNNHPSNITALEALFPSVNPLNYVPPILFYAAILWVLLKHELMPIFSSSIKTGIITISATIIIQVLGILSMFYL